MHVSIPHLSLQAFIALSLFVASPWLYYTRSSSRLSSALLLLHTLYLLHALLVSPPTNIFKSLDLPLNIPSEYLRLKLLQAYGGRERDVPAHLASLPQRLGLMELRSLYVRFGHKVITGCSFCQSTGDYALYAMPEPFLEYTSEVAFIGILTLPRAPFRPLRPLALGVLLASGLMEIYCVLSIQVVIPPFAGDVDASITMWHDAFVQLRRTLFLVLPLALSILIRIGTLVHLRSSPPSPSFSSKMNDDPISHQRPILTTTKSLHRTLAHLTSTLHLLKFAHAAVMRSSSSSSRDSANHHQHQDVGDNGTSNTSSSDPPTPHALATAWWAREALEGQIICADWGVRRALRSEGLVSGSGGSSPSDCPAASACSAYEGEDEQEEDGETTADDHLLLLPRGQLLLSAKMAVKMLIEQGASPSEHWSTTTTRGDSNS